MNIQLETAKEKIQRSGLFANLVVREENGELHLMTGDDCFARLVPTERDGIWRLESFRNTDRWDRVDFQGTLEECLDFLAESEHYLFWNG